jgi:hypothetical protein
MLSFLKKTSYSDLTKQTLSQYRSHQGMYFHGLSQDQEHFHAVVTVH